MNWDEKDQPLPIEVPDPWDNKVAEMISKDQEFIRQMNLTPYWYDL